MLFNASIDGMRVSLTRLDVNANNIANATTGGFKSSRVNTVSKKGGGVAVGSIQMNFQPGPLETGDGTPAIFTGDFVAVQTANGIAFSKGGVLSTDGQGFLLLNGNRVAPGIQLPNGSKGFFINQDGVIFAITDNGNVEVGQLQIARFRNNGGLVAQGGGVFTPGPASGDPQPVAAGANIIFGAFEGSNVNLVDEMISLITTRASFLANSRAFKVQNSLIGTILDITR